MTDEELIARLLDWPTCGWNEVIQMRKDAADRIEALLLDRNNLSDKLELERSLTDGAHRRAKAAEAKLAKATEVLREIEKRASETNRLGAVTGGHWTRLTIACLTARAALADLEKIND